MKKYLKDKRKTKKYYYWNRDYRFAKNGQWNSRYLSKSHYIFAVSKYIRTIQIQVLPPDPIIDLFYNILKNLKLDKLTYKNPSDFPAVKKKLKIPINNFAVLRNSIIIDKFVETENVFKKIKNYNHVIPILYAFEQIKQSHSTKTNQLVECFEHILRKIYDELTYNNNSTDFYIKFDIDKKEHNSHYVITGTLIYYNKED